MMGDNRQDDMECWFALIGMIVMATIFGLSIYVYCIR